MESSAFSDRQPDPAVDLEPHHHFIETPDRADPPQSAQHQTPARKARVYRVLHYHQHAALHGSLWHGSYSTADLRPYLYAARCWLKLRQTDQLVIDALRRTYGLLETNRPLLIRKTMRLHPRPERERARILFARLRHAQPRPEEILAIYLAIAALIREDIEADRSTDFLVTQVAKAVLRQSSGHYTRVYVDRGNGAQVRTEADSFFRGTGIVLRSIGSPIEETCGAVADAYLLDILTLKIRDFGIHPSRQRGAKPRWCRALSSGKRVH